MKLENFFKCICILKSAQDRAGRVGTDENPVKITEEEEAKLRGLGWFEQSSNKSEVKDE